MMTIASNIGIENHFKEGGFFFDFRYGKFNDLAYMEVLETLQEIDLSGPLIPKKVISLIWDLPFFMLETSPVVIEKDGRRKKIIDACFEIHRIISEKINS